MNIAKSKNFSIIALCLFIGGAVGAQTADVAAKADEYMRARMEARGYGGSILIAKDDKPLIVKGYGSADVEAGIANSPDTRFRIGSITKQFTAAGILLLHEDGKLNVNDPICKYIAECPEAWKPITLHHLATMASGITNVTSLPEFREFRLKDARPEETLALVRNLPLKASPGEVYEYSNSNYLLLGTVIEKVSGLSYEAFLKERILEPLGLKNTGYDHGRERLPNSALGYTISDEKIVPATKASMAIPFSAGSLYSTTGDLHKWTTSLLAGKLFRKPEMLEMMLAPNKGNYAYGVIVATDNNGRRRITHGGSIEGFVSDAVYFPNEKVFIAALINNDRGAASEALRDLTAIYFGEPYSLPKKRVAIKVAPEILDSYVGEYKLGGALTFKIARAGDALTLEPPGQRIVPLFAESETLFFLTVAEVTIKFVKDENGKVTGFDFTQSGRTSRVVRVESSDQ